LISGLVGVESSLAAVAGLPPAELLALFSGEHQHRYFCGEITENDYLDAVIRLAPSLTRERLRAAIRENFRQVIPGTAELAARLATGYRVVLLSDHGREWVEHILEIHPWLMTLEERHFSFERGVTKRQAEAFRGLAVTLGAPPGNCLLIDDSERNVELARQSGWQAIRFTDSERLSQELQRRGLLPLPDRQAGPKSSSPRSVLATEALDGRPSAHPEWEARPQRVVVAGFIHDGEELLLARRAATKNIAPGKYHLPGGHVEYGEHPAAALARELQEELTASVQVAEPLLVFSYLWGGAHTVGLVYRVELKGTRDELRWDLNDIAECVWVPEERLGEYLAQDDHNFQAAIAGFEQLRRTR
jgi:8-oxo-dGTP pyrophosphatase MutT (NUDIX family)/FMN phosphatase YigB (HAD superfamily)